MKNIKSKKDELKGELNKTWPGEITIFIRINLFTSRLIIKASIELILPSLYFKLRISDVINEISNPISDPVALIKRIFDNSSGVNPLILPVVII